MPSSHAKCSASAANRWIHCPGSIKLSELCPPPKPSPFAEEGTVAHSLAELKLRKAIADISLEAFDAKYAKIKKSSFYNMEMEDATDFYADAVLAEVTAGGKSATLMIEQKLDLTRWVPEGFGTSDAVIVTDDYIQVCDLKYGTGVKVDATDNPQLRLYGLGAAELFSGVMDFKQVKTLIIQPRLDHISGETNDLKDLLRWGEEEVAPKARQAMEGTEEFEAGDWCRFCPCSAQCRTRAKANLELAKLDFSSPNLLSDEEIAQIVAKADELAKWASSVKDYMFQQALGGRSFPGWKLVEGRSNRKYTDTVKVAETLIKNGYEEAIIYKKELLGIIEMEKTVGKKKFDEILKGLVEKPQGKPVLVPETDKRKAIASVDGAIADFS